MTFTEAFAYFWTVGTKRHYFLAAFAVIVAMGLFLEFTAGGSSDFATVMILIVQLFAVSTGFSFPASRGFYDPVLTRSGPTLRSVAAHFAVSALPGCLAWTILAAIEAVRAGSPNVIALQPSALAGLAFVSAVAWSLSLPFMPFAAAGVWLMASIGIFVSGRFMASLAPLARDPGWATDHPGRALLVTALFPIMTPGISLPRTTLAALAVIAIAAFAAGVFFVQRRDFPLAEES